MRKTLGETKEALEFLEDVESLDKDQRDVFGAVVKTLVKCFTGEDTQAVVIVRRKDNPVKVLALNCDELESADMVRGLQEYLDFATTQDAPAKEMFN